MEETRGPGKPQSGKSDDGKNPSDDISTLFNSTTELPTDFSTKFLKLSVVHKMIHDKISEPNESYLQAEKELESRLPLNSIVSELLYLPDSVHIELQKMTDRDFRQRSVSAHQTIFFSYAKLAVVLDGLKTIRKEFMELCKSMDIPAGPFIAKVEGVETEASLCAKEMSEAQEYILNYVAVNFDALMPKPSGENAGLPQQQGQQATDSTSAMPNVDTLNIIGEEDENSRKDFLQQISKTQDEFLQSTNVKREQYELLRGNMVRSSSLIGELIERCILLAEALEHVIRAKATAQTGV